MNAINLSEVSAARLLADRINEIPSGSREQRWAAEAAFFDALAGPLEKPALTPDPPALERYTWPEPRRRFNMELRFRAMGPLAGKRILDVGCGSGLSALRFARLGATVTAIDLSPKQLEIARNRMQVNGVSDRVSLVCAPVETVELEDDFFDIIWVDATLHHLLDELEPVMRRLVRWIHPGGTLVFAEPVSLFEPWRLLRRLLPAGGPARAWSERPLLPAEIDKVLAYLDKPRLRHYRLGGWPELYERSPWPRRALVNTAALLDYVLFALPGIRRLAGTCVIYGYPRKELPTKCMQNTNAYQVEPT